jgi:outer membrane lipoprotein-sorting protein
MIFGMNSPIHAPADFTPRPARAPAHRVAGCAVLILALASMALSGRGACADVSGVDLDSILASLAKRQHGHVLYSEQIESALLKRPLHTSGELFFDAPDRLEKRTLQPRADDLLVEGDVVTIVRGTHRTAMRLADYPQLSPLLNAIRATLAGDRPTLEKNFQITASADGPGWSLTLEPLPSETKPVYKRIQIRGGDGAVRSVMLERVTGERTTMTLSEPAES